MHTINVYTYAVEVICTAKLESICIHILSGIELVLSLPTVGSVETSGGDVGSSTIYGVFCRLCITATYVHKMYVYEHL